MNLLAIISQSRRLPLDKRYAVLLSAKSHFKPRSIDMQHLLKEIEHVPFRRLKRDCRRAA
jgi:hypothetical protein